MMTLEQQTAKLKTLGLALNDGVTIDDLLYSFVTERNWRVEVNDDWADMMTISYVMDDTEHDCRKFYFEDNGQAMVFYCLDPATANELNELSGNALKPVLPE
jgi:hypothetical protein